MSLQNNNFISFDGEALGGRIPTTVGTRGKNRPSPELMAAVSAAYNQFCISVNTSNHPLGVHTKHHTFKDGSKATLSSNNGAHRIRVDAAPGSVLSEQHEIKEREEWLKINTFFCIPFDKTYASLAVDDIYGLSRWPDISKSPAAHLFSKLKKLKEHPGNTNWFPTGNPNHVFKHIVLSWWGPNQRYENAQNYGYRTTEWAGHLQYTFPWESGAPNLSPPMAHLHKTTLSDETHVQGAIPWMWECVWLNGRPIEVWKKVLSACAADLSDSSGKKHVVRIVVSDTGILPTHIIEMPLPLMISLSLLGGALTEEKVTEFGKLTAVSDMAAGLGVQEVGGLSQPPFWNSSGTKAIGIAYVRVEDKSDSIDYKPSLAPGLSSPTTMTGHSTGDVGLVVYELDAGGVFSVVDRSTHNASASGNTDHTGALDLGNVLFNGEYQHSIPDPYTGEPMVVSMSRYKPEVLRGTVAQTPTTPSTGDSGATMFKLGNTFSLQSKKPLAADFYGDTRQILHSEYTESAHYRFEGESTWQWTMTPSTQNGSIDCECATSFTFSATGALYFNGQQVSNKSRSGSLSSSGVRNFLTAAGWGYAQEPWENGAWYQTNFQRETSDISTASGTVTQSGFAANFTLSAGDLRGGKIIVSENVQPLQFRQFTPGALTTLRYARFYSYLANPDVVSPPYSRMSSGADCRGMLMPSVDITNYEGGGEFEFTHGYTLSHPNAGEVGATITPTHEISGGYSYDQPVTQDFIFDSKTNEVVTFNARSSSYDGTKSATWTGEVGDYEPLLEPRVMGTSLMLDEPTLSHLTPVVKSPWQFVVGPGNLSGTRFSGEEYLTSSSNEAKCLPNFMVPGTGFTRIFPIPELDKTSYSFESNAVLGFNGTFGWARSAVFSSSALSPDGKIQYLGYLMYSDEYVPGDWGAVRVSKGDKWFANGAEITLNDPYPKNDDFKMLSSPVFTGPLPPKKEFPWR